MSSSEGKKSYFEMNLLFEMNGEPVKTASDTRSIIRAGSINQSINQSMRL